MDAKWLNDQFDKNPTKSKGDLSALLGMQASAISKMLAGTRQIKAREYMLMRKFFDMPTGDRADRKVAAALSDGILYAAEKSSAPWQTTNQKSYDVIEVTDTSMIPDFLPGEKVLIDRNIDLDQKSGIFVIEEQDRPSVRILELMPQAKIKITTLSKEQAAKIMPQARVKILGRVIAKLNWL